MNLFTNGVGRPSNETIKKRNVFKGICAVLVLLILGLVGYILNDKGIISLNNKKESGGNDNIVITTLNKSESKSEKVNIEEAKKELERYVLFNYSDLKNIDSEGYKGFLAIKKSKSTDKYKCEEIFADQASRCTTSVVYDNLFYEYDVVNKQYKELFGIELPKKDIAIDFKYTESYVYSKTKNGFVFISPEGSDVYPYEITKILDAYRIDDELHIKYTSMDYLGNIDGTLEIVSIDSKTLEQKISVDAKVNNSEIINGDELLDKYESELPKYEIILSEHNGSYLYKNIKEMK